MTFLDANQNIGLKKDYWNQLRSIGQLLHTKKFLQSDEGKSELDGTEKSMQIGVDPEFYIAFCHYRKIAVQVLNHFT